MKINRHIPVPINHYYHVERPYEVIKYIKKPYIVKVERKVPVEVIKKIPVPQPILKIESVIAEPQHIHADQLGHSHGSQLLVHRKLHKRHQYPSSIHIFGKQPKHSIHYFRRKRKKILLKH